MDMAGKRSNKRENNKQLNVTAHENENDVLKHVAGSKLDSFNNQAVNDAIQALWLPGKGDGATEPQGDGGMRKSDYEIRRAIGGVSSCQTGARCRMWKNDSEIKLIPCKNHV